MSAVITMPATVDQENEVRALAAELPGRLVLPGDHDFDGARQVWNAAVDCRPKVIVRCHSAAEVAAAVNVARQCAMSLSVRSGGHSIAGHGTNDSGMVIDLSPMKAIAIDAVQRTARLEPGLTWAEVASATHPYGLALTSGNMGSVGVGGLLLGGGIGWMVRKFGLTIDRLRAVELVTADGCLRRASADENADLFWGLRGGGGNFGVATAFEVDLHAAGTVLGGAVFYDASNVDLMARAYAHLAACAPDELTTAALLLTAPPAPFIPREYWGKPVIAIQVCYTGRLAEGRRLVAPLRTLGTPIADMIAPMPYPNMFAMTVDGTVRGLSHYGYSVLLNTINDDALAAFATEMLVGIAPGVIGQIQVLGGAMSRVLAGATAFAHRDAQLMFVVSCMAPGQESAGPLRASVDQVWRAVRPYGTGVYVNFLGDEGEQRIHEAYPEAAYARLSALKQRYDPANLFHLNQNILPHG